MKFIYVIAMLASFTIAGCNSGLEGRLVDLPDTGEADVQSPLPTSEGEPSPAAIPEVDADDALIFRPIDKAELITGEIGEFVSQPGFGITSAGNISTSHGTQSTTNYGQSAFQEACELVDYDIEMWDPNIEDDELPITESCKGGIVFDLPNITSYVDYRITARPANTIINKNIKALVNNGTVMFDQWGGDSHETDWLLRINPSKISDLTRILDIDFEPHTPGCVPIEGEYTVRFIRAK